MNDERVRFYHMGQYFEYDHDIPDGNDDWHFISVTYRRFGFSSFTDIYPIIDDRKLDPY